MILYLMINSFLTKQHIYLKFIFIIISLIFVFLADTKTVSLFLVLNSILFLPILLPFLKIVIKLSYFWIFYLICGIIFNLDYMLQINFLIRMGFMLQISVFLQKTVCFQVLIHDMRYLLKFNAFQIILLFILNLNSYLKYLSISFLEAEPQKIPIKNRFSLSYIEIITHHIKSTLENTEGRYKIEDFKPDKELNLGSRLWANLYIMLIIGGMIFFFETLCN